MDPADVSTIFTPDKIAAHGFSLSALYLAFSNWLPHGLQDLAILAPTVYYCFVIFEMKTVQRWLRLRRRHQRRVKLRRKGRLPQQRP